MKKITILLFIIFNTVTAYCSETVNKEYPSHPSFKLVATKEDMGEASFYVSGKWMASSTNHEDDASVFYNGTQYVNLAKTGGDVYLYPWIDALNFPHRGSGSDGFIPSGSGRTNTALKIYKNNLLIKNSDHGTGVTLIYRAHRYKTDTYTSYISGYKISEPGVYYAKLYYRDKDKHWRNPLHYIWKYHNITIPTINTIKVVNDSSTPIISTGMLYRTGRKFAMDVFVKDPSLSNATIKLYKADVLIGSYSNNAIFTDYTHQLTFDSSGTYSIEVTANDAWGYASETYRDFFTIDLDGPTHGLAEETDSRQHVWTNQDSYSITANPQDSNGGVVVKYYWKIIKKNIFGRKYWAKINPESKTVTVTSNNRVKFYVEDNSGNSTYSDDYQIKFDRTPPILTSAEFRAFRINPVNGHPEAKVRWSLPAPDDGSPIVEAESGLKVNSKVHTNNSNGFYYIDIASNNYWGSTLNVSVYAKDEAGNSSISSAANSLTIRVPRNIGNISVNEPQMNIVSNVTHYRFNIPLVYDSSTNYVASLFSNDGSILYNSKKLNYNTGSGYEYIVNQNGLGGKTVQLKVEVISANPDGTVVVLDRYTKSNLVLSKVGSKPIVELKNGSGFKYIKDQPVFKLNEMYSEPGLDIDGNAISYVLKVYNPDGSFLNQWNVIDYNNITLPINTLNATGDYTYKIVPSDGNPEVGVTVGYDNVAPKNAVLTAEQIYNTNIIDVGVSDLADVGPAGLSRIVFDINGAVRSVSLDGFNGNSKTFNLDLGNVNSGEVATKTMFATVYDKAGNISLTNTISIVVDKEVPVVTRESSVLSTDSIKFRWSCPDQVSYRINSGAWQNSSTLKEYTLPGLAPNTLRTITVETKDLAGNISAPLSLTNTTLDVLDTISATSFSTIRSGDTRLVQVEFNTTAAKSGRYIINTSSTDIGLSKYSEEYNPVTGKYKVLYKYSSKTASSYVFKIRNSAGDINPHGLTINYTPNNFAPEIGGGFETVPANNGYLSATGDLSWSGIKDIDNESLLYTVTLKLADGTVKSKSGIDVNNINIDTLFNELFNRVPTDKEVVKWSIEATDGITSIKTEEFTFNIDDKLSTVETTNTRTNGYTTKLVYKITDDGSGVKEVVIKNGETVLTPTVTDNNYEVDLSVFGSGSYDAFKVIVTDNVGNELTHIQPGIEIDSVNPEIIGDIKTALVKESGKYLNTMSKFSVNFDVKDDLSGVTDIYYLFNNSDTLPANANWKFLESSSSGGYVKSLEGNKEVSIEWNFDNGVSKYLFIKVIDDSGRYSNYKKLLLPIYTDTTVPELVTKNVTGLITSDYNSYLTGIDNIGITADFIDTDQNPANIEVSKTQYILRSKDGDKVLKAIGSSSFNNVLLTDGVDYDVIVKAYNNAGKETEVKLDSFVYDSKNPLNGIISLTDTGSYISNETIKIQLEAEDLGSGISYSEVKIGSTLGGNDLFLGTVNRGWRFENGKYSNLFNYKLPKEAADGTYYIKADFYDFVGKKTTATKSFTVDNNIEKLNLNLSSYTSTKDNNRFSFSFNHMDRVQKVEYRINSGSWNLIDSNDYLLDLLLKETLAHGERNLIEVKLTTLGNNEHLDAGYIVYDETPPVDNGEDSNLWSKYVTPENLKVKWDLNDPESDIYGINHSIDKLVNGEWINVVDSAPVEPLVSIGEINFKLNEVKGDKYRVRREVTNGAGLVSGRTSWIIEVDDDIPGELNNIIDNANYLKPVGTTARVNWINTQGDEDSGMTYYWTFSKNVVDLNSITNWNNGDETRRVVVDIDTLSVKPVHGETWYFYIKGVNGAGMVTYGTTNGIIFDKDAPDNMELRLVSDLSPAHINYLTTEENLKLNIEANDTSGSVITYSGDYGTLDSKGNYLRLSTENKYSGTENSYPVVKSEITAIDGIILFRATATDEAGNITSEGFSAGTVYDNKEPEVFDPGYYIDNGLLTAYWDSVIGGTQMDYYYIRLLDHKGSDVTIPGNIAGKVLDKQISFELDSLDNGVYSLNIQGVSRSGLRSQFVSITDIVVDNSIPVVHGIVTQEYLYRDIVAKIDISDIGSGINEYHYSVGTVANNSALTGDWIKVKKSLLNGVFELTDNLYNYNGYRNISDGERVYLFIKVKDRVGNWSEIGQSEGILFDSTLPEGVVIQHTFNNELSRFQNSVPGVTIDGYDYISSIKNIEVNLYKVENGVDNLVATVVEALGRDEIKLTDYTLTNNLDLTDTGVYRLGVRASNFSEVYGPIEYSDTFTVDLTYPTISFDNNLWVFNNNITNVLYTRSEEATVEFKLFKEGDTTPVKTEALNSGAPFVFDHGFVNEENAYGNYQLTTVLTDLAGNISTYETDASFIQNIRYNEPPHIILNSDYSTTPGKPYVVKALNIYDRDDEDELLTYKWEFRTNGHSNISASTIKEPTVKFYHLSNSVSESTYDVSIEVTDYYGKSRSKTFSVVVENTSYGTLYTDEYWMGEHNLTGKVIVPANISLTVEDNSNILASEDGEIAVNGSITANNSQFMSMYGELWKGIVINDGGGGTIMNSSITEAFRGVTVKNMGNLYIDGTTIEDNRVGIHAYNSSPVIIDCRIINNFAYGIKEDGESSEPIIDDLTEISGNRIDIYDSIDTYNPGDAE